MKAARTQVILGFFLTLLVVAAYKIISAELVDPDLRQARLTYQMEKLTLEREQLKRDDALEAEQLRVKQATLQRNTNVSFYGLIGVLSACGIAVIILATGYSRAKMKRAAVHLARIGQHSEIPIHQKDLQNFYPIAVNLSLAEIEASTSATHEKAYHISRQMLDDITEYTRAIAGKRGMLALRHGAEEDSFIDLPASTATPTFAELLRNGTLAPGKPLVLGYDRQGQPHARTLQDLKSLAVAGWQGSGKTLSMGYILAASILAYRVQVYVVDPHKHHPESLSTLIKPLEQTGHVTIINPFDTPALIQDLHAMLDRRLNGEEPSEPGILLVIDEMARLAKMECFDVLIAFLERCTEETRKANITFIGGSNKWTARHFKGRADIRGCMNSMLIHKMKPSQADLLLEDAHDKHLVKQLQRPGDAILATDFDPPQLVAVPFCTRDDMNTVAEFLTRKTTRQPSALKKITEPLLVVKPSAIATPEHNPATPPPTRAPMHPEEPRCQIRLEERSRPRQMTSGGRKRLSDVIPFEVHFRRKYPTARPDTPSPRHLTAEMIRDRFNRLKADDPYLTQKKIAEQVGMSPGQFSDILRGKRPIQEKFLPRLYEALFTQHLADATATGK